MVYMPRSKGVNFLPITRDQRIKLRQWVFKISHLSQTINALFDNEAPAYLMFLEASRFLFP